MGYSVFLVLITIVCLLLILAIMVQNPKGGGLSSSFGGGSQVGGVQKTNDFLDKSTWALASLLLVLILLSNITLNNNNNESRASSYFVENASFLRLRSVKASYTIPLKDQKSISLSVEGQNLLTLTNYSGVDPEVTFSGNANFPGIDRGAYPLARTFLFGINFKM